jgi:hypothetical protein
MFRFFLRRKPTPRGKPLETLLVKDSPVVNKTHLKKRLIKEGHLKNKCDWCGIGPKWRGRPMTLEMDHINGDNSDNRLKNLRILCLNCHSQTPTFRRPKGLRPPRELVSREIVVKTIVVGSGILMGIGLYVSWW